MLRVHFAAILLVDPTRPDGFQLDILLLFDEEQFYMLFST
jgi:hypothetical protein